MSKIKCPSCGYRNFYASTACINCDVPLVPLISPVDEVSDAESLSARSQAPRLPALSPSCIPAQKKKPPMQLIPPQMPIKEQRRDLEPYSPTPLTMPSPTSLFESDTHKSQTIITEVKEIKSPTVETWSRGELPWWFPRRPAEIAGTVINVQTQQREKIVSGSFLRTLRDMIWIMPGGYEGQSEKETTQTTTVRVRTLDGAQKDALIHGYFTRANVSLGDKVSFWGWKRGGILLVRRAYNHTAGAIVTTRSMTSPLLFLLLIILLIMGLLYLFATHSLTFPPLPDISPEGSRTLEVLSLIFPIVQQMRMV